MGIRQIERWGIRWRDGTGQHNLSLYAGDAVDRQAVLALEISDEVAQVRIKYVAYGNVARLTLYSLQALS